MTSPRRHQQICDQFLAHAREELARGDRLQAAEKAWGAVAHCINSISKDKGWEVGSHRRIIDNARKLIATSDAAGDKLRLQLNAAQLLHKNFYEEIMSEEEVREGIDSATELVTALKQLADA